MAGEMNPMMAAVCKVLQRNPKALFADVKAKVAKHGELYPIVYGRAKALLGLVMTKPRKDRVATEVPVKRGPGRPRKTPLDAVAASHERKARAASNGSPDDGLTSKLEALLAERDALNARITTIVDALNQ